MQLKTSDEHRALMVTCPSDEVAHALAERLVEAKAAACVNILPGLLSVYAWKGEICRDPEVLLIIKSSSSRLPAVATIVQEVHPYSEPELIALPIVEGSATYLNWVTTETDPGD